MNNSTGDDLQAYKYNSKELVTKFGLNEYDSQARMYYAAIMRTTTMDPLAEKYYHISPYAWCGNNPENKFDIDGRKVYRLNKQGYYEGTISDSTQDIICMNGHQITFEHGSITDYLHDDYRTEFTFKDKNVAAEAFKFMADNSDVEYALLLANEEASKIITNYMAEKVYMTDKDFESMPTLYASIHNHPNNSKPSGFYGKEKGTGDKKAATSLLSFYKREILTYVYWENLSCLIPFNTESIGAGLDWGTVFTPSGKMLTLISPVKKYLSHTSLVLPKIKY